MSNKLIPNKFEKYIVTFNEEGWINATQIASNYGRRVRDWLDLTSTKEYIEALEDQLSIQKKSLLKIKRGGRGKTDATWLHPKLAIRFAQWLDVRFAVWCDQQIENIIHGVKETKEDRMRSRHKASVSFKILSEALETNRLSKGKLTKSHHYANEARLINYALSGKFCSIDRDSLPKNELDILASLEIYNMMLIVQNHDYEKRKEKLIEKSRQLRQNQIKKLEGK